MEDDVVADEAADHLTADQEGSHKVHATNADAFAGWCGAVERLLGIYGDVQRRALLPTVTGTTKSDRRKLSREFGALRSARSGESPLWITPVPRWLVNYFVAEHLGSRLRLMRGCILVDHRMSDDQQDQLLAKIDRLLPLWPERSAVGFFYRYVLPLAAIIAAGWHFIAAGLTDAENTIGLFTLLFVYAAVFLAVLGLSFVNKRGLMLGGIGVAEEALVFGVLAPARREPPLDLLLLAAAVPLLLCGLVVGLGLLLTLPPWALVAVGLVITSGWFTLNIVAFIRRRRLGRC